MIKSKYITHIILEGTDGVGKDTIKEAIWRLYDFKYRVSVRGELSDYVYAKKYNRQFHPTERGLPFLYILLIKDKDTIINQINKRAKENNWTLEQIDEEIAKINDQDLFIECANEIIADYHILSIDITGLSLEEATQMIYNQSLEYIDALEDDLELNPFNEMYRRGCEKLGIKWHCKNNQPFMDNIMIMADAQLHNGSYETYSDKTIPHNLIFSYGYENTNLFLGNKKYDFAYPINSKILSRKEIYDYINEITKEHTLLTTNSKYIPDNDNIIRMEKVFYDDYIKAISSANATIYCSRDLSYLKMMTVRCYEAVLANQIIFVDKQTDPNCEILTQIYGNDEILKDLLYVTPQTINDNYDAIMQSNVIVMHILAKQREWYNKLINELKETYIRKKVR